MRRSSAVIGALMVVALLAAAPQNPMTQGYYFTDVGGNDATVSMVYNRVSDAETIFYKFTTSDTNAKSMAATGETWYEDYDSIIIEGATDDAFELTVEFPDVGADATIVFGTVHVTWAQGGAPADAIDQTFWIADRAYIITKVNATWMTAESTGAMDIMVEKLAGVTACASGTDILASAIDATGTADTTATGSLHATAANYTLAAGDTLCVDLTATPSEVVGMVVSITMTPI